MHEGTCSWETPTLIITLLNDLYLRQVPSQSLDSILGSVFVPCISGARQISCAAGVVRDGGQGAEHAAEDLICVLGGR